MPKKITLTINDAAYTRFCRAAEHDNRTVSNLMGTIALKKLDEDYFCEGLEMGKILSNSRLLKKLSRGHAQALRRKGKFVA